MPEPERGLAGIHARAEELELEGRLEISEVGWYGRAYPQARLARAEVRVAVGSELALERGELGGPHHVEPVGLDLIGVVPRVHHGEAVHLELRFAVLRGKDRGQAAQQQDEK